MPDDTFLGPHRPGMDPAVRGDVITADRYFSLEWAQWEWDKLWTKTWHIGGMVAQLEEAGDWIKHDIARESVIMVRQSDGSVKAFYNACRHRGNRLVFTDAGGAPTITCSYHGWKYAPDGSLAFVQDAEDFAGGSPCGKVRLIELQCAIWGGFIWFNMDPNAKPLNDWLGQLPQELSRYGMEKWTRVLWLSADVKCNWKVIRDNFNESYHLPNLHPELATFINDDYTDTVFELYPDGHNRMVMKGCEATGRAKALYEGAVPAPLDSIIQAWGLDPAAYTGKGAAIRPDVIKAKRELGPKRGFGHYAALNDSELVDYYHYTLFPNVSLTMSADGFQMLRTEPHPTDPERCIFDHWFIMPPVDGMNEVETPVGKVPFIAAERIFIEHGQSSLGFVADQDLSVAESQQLGLRSRGYVGSILSHQEKRIQRFHELLNDCLGS